MSIVDKEGKIWEEKKEEDDDEKEEKLCKHEERKGWKSWCK